MASIVPRAAQLSRSVPLSTVLRDHCVIRWVVFPWGKVFAVKARSDPLFEVVVFDSFLGDVWGDDARDADYAVIVRNDVVAGFDEDAVAVDGVVSGVRGANASA